MDTEHASLDQFNGVKRAYDAGYKKVAVTVANPDVAARIRKAYPDAIIFGVHVTGLEREEAESMVGVADLMTACASKTVREVAGAKALCRPGSGYPSLQSRNGEKRSSSKRSVRPTSRSSSNQQNFRTLTGSSLTRWYEENIFLSD